MSSGVACGGGGEPYFYSMPPCSHDNFLRRPKGDLNHDVVVKALPMTPLSPTSNSNMNSACMSPVPASSSDNKQGQKATTSSAPRRVSTLSVVPVDHHHHEVQEQEGKTVPPRPPARLQQQQHPRTSLPPVQSSSTCCLKLSPQRRVRRAAAPHLFRQAMQKASASVPPVPMTTSPDVRYLTGRGGGGHGARQDDMVNHQQPHARYNIVPGSPLAEQQDAPNCTRNYSLLPLPPTNWSTSPSNNCMASSSSSPPPPPPFFPMCMPDMMMSAPPSSLEQQGGQANNNNNNSSRFLHHHQMTSSHAHQQTNLTPRRVSNNYMADDTCCFFEGHEFQVIDDASLEAFESAMRMHV